MKHAALVPEHYKHTEGEHGLSGPLNLNTEKYSLCNLNVCEVLVGGFFPSQPTGPRVSRPGDPVLMLQHHPRGFKTFLTFLILGPLSLEISIYSFFF